MGERNHLRMECKEHDLKKMVAASGRERRRIDSREVERKRQQQGREHISA